MGKGIKFMKILILEDEISLRDIYTRALNQKYPGVEVVSVENGQEGLEVVKINKDFDLIITDINMPVMNGWDFLRQISGQMPKAPRLIISGYVDNEETAKSLFPDCRYLAKPITLALFFNVLDQIILNN